MMEKSVASREDIPNLVLGNASPRCRQALSSLESFPPSPNTHSASITSHALAPSPTSRSIAILTRLLGTRRRPLEHRWESGRHLADLDRRSEFLLNALGQPGKTGHGA